MRKGLLVSGLSLTMSLVFFLVFGIAPVMADTVKVGVVGPRTGTAAATGKAFEEGIKLAVAYVNSKG
ncbi:MAG: amino acid ABC transporter substrate-binding protein, partial [Deltaproteobacteria bacterium]|nr:amino acid ABC transporter substrate-binding protein [Deltaproteobacteria bacterium]